MGYRFGVERKPCRCGAAHCVPLCGSLSARSRSCRILRLFIPFPHPLLTIVWREQSLSGNVAGTHQANAMNLKPLHPRDQLVAIMNRIYHNDMTTLSGGNLSIKDDDGAVWITPSGIDKGRLTAADIMCVRANGRITGPHRPSMEYPFHRQIYTLRPDFKAIVHAHPPALIAFSIVRQTPNTQLIPRVHQTCGDVGYASYARPGSEELGQNIADTFAKGHHVVMLENHGAAAGGATLFAAFARLEALDFFARTLIRARALGEIQTLPEAAREAAERPFLPLPEFTPTAPDSREQALRQQVVDIAARAYDRQLMTSIAGVVSTRLDARRFLITPAGHDRRALAAADVVLVQDGACEAGKQPDQPVQLHAALYAQHPDLNAVLMAPNPNATAYALAAVKFDSRLIPESFVMLRDVPLLPFMMAHTQPQKVAAAASLRNPVLLLQHEGVLAVGTDLLNAFDRLEVAEYSARALLDTAVLGPLVPIGDEEIRDLEVAFSLP